MRFLHVLSTIISVSLLPTPDLFCQTPSRSELLITIEKEYANKNNETVLELTRDARANFDASPDSLYIHMLYFEGLSLYQLKRLHESFKTCMYAINKYEKFGKDDQLLYRLYGLACYQARNHHLDEFSLSIAHRFLSLKYWYYKDYDLYRSILFKELGQLTDEKRLIRFNEEVVFTNETNHKYLTSYLYFVFGYLQLVGYFDSTDYYRSIDTISNNSDRVKSSIPYLEKAAAGLKGSNNITINKYYVETLLLLCSAYEALDKQEMAKQEYEQIWPIILSNWEDWESSTPFSDPDFFRGKNTFDDLRILDAYICCLDRISDYEQIINVCKSVMELEWFEDTASNYQKNTIIRYYNSAAALIEVPELEEFRIEITERPRQSNPAILIPYYHQGTLTDERLKEEAQKTIVYGELDYSDPFVEYLDSIGDYKTIIKYIRFAIDDDLSNDEYMGGAIDMGDNSYSIGGYCFSNDSGIDLTKVTKDDIHVGWERDFIHHMNGIYSIVYAYNMLASAYWNNEEYSSAISTLERLYEIVRTDWKWDPGERESIFKMELSGDDYEVWPVEYYFSMEIDVQQQLAAHLYAVGRENEAYQYWQESLALTKRILTYLLSTGDYAIKSQRWSQWFWPIQEIINQSRNRKVTSELSSIILDAVTFQNGYLTHLSSNIQSHILQNNNDELMYLYNQYKQKEFELEQVYYKNGVMGKDIENLKRQLATLSNKLFSSIPSNAILPTDSSPIDRLNDVLGEDDCFVQFVSRKYGTISLTLVSSYDSTRDRELEIPLEDLSAIVYCNKMDGPLFVPIGSLEDNLFVKNDGRDGEEFISAYNPGIKKEDIDYLYKSTSLGEGIWKGLIDVLNIQKAKRVYFIPSGLINNIAIENLTLADGTLVDSVLELHRITSIDAIPKANNHYSPNSYGIVVGGIQYGTSKATKYDRTDNTQKQLSPIIDRESLGKLIGTQLEMEDIYSLAPQFFQTKTGIEANEEFFASLSGQSPQILHIGTHGINKTYDSITDKEYDYLYGYQSYGSHNYVSLSHSERAMYETGLMVAPSQEINTSGLLTAKEISLLDFSKTDLVSLSACSTGIGVVDNEGVNGLFRAFKLSGANSIIASLWDVNDDATRLLMKEFYRCYIVERLTKTESLRKAKEYVRTYSDGGVNEFGAVNISNNKYKYSDPYYWAGFILVD